MTAVDVRPAERGAADGAADGATVGGRRYWPVLDGLRVVAVLLVLGFHAGVPGMDAGFIGVDVFFVISGFLITGQLVDELTGTGRVALGAFWARRVRRLLPTAGVVVAATALGTYLLLPPLASFRQSTDLLAAMGYVANWRFIAQGQDYLAPAAGESPVLHFWSLAVEEQFYLVWPLLLLGVALLVRRRGADLVRSLVVAFGLAAVVSFAWSFLLTASDASVAYLATPARVWQFAAGALLALALRRLPDGLPAGPTARRLHLAGGALLVASLVLIDAGTPYPGLAALLPTAAALALIAGGVVGVAGLSLSAPVRHLAALSYGWYLWHWPVLVLARADRPGMGWQEALAWTLLAGVLAELSYQLVERPVRRSTVLRTRPAAALSSGLLASVVAVSTALVLGSVSARALASPAGVDAATFEVVFGAGDARDAGLVDPAPLAAAGDVPSHGCIVERSAVLKDCTYGADRGRTVVLFGDSLAGQWQPAVEELATRYGWRVHELTQAGCPAARIAPRDTSAWFAQDFCLDWREKALRRISELDPSMIIVSSLNDYIERGTELQHAWRATVDDLSATGAPIVYLRSTPNPEDDVPTCVSGSLDRWSACAFPADDELDPMVVEAESGRMPQVRVVDLNGYLCQDGRCPAVRNGILLYRDDDHLSATAARVLAPALENQLAGLDLLR